MSLTKTQAIQNALLGDWNTAITLNLQLLKEDPNDIETLNRLAFAFSILGKIKDARATYQQVLAIDPLNPIALRGIKKLIGATSNKNQKVSDSILHHGGIHGSNIFIEETGKTKVIELINIADKKTVSRLRNGELLSLSIKRLKIFVLNEQKEYVGMLPDNIGKRLLKFIKGGNQYDAYIKSLERNQIIIFIRETKRATRFKNQPSFLSPDKSHLVFTKTPKHSDSSGDLDDDDHASGSLDSEDGF